jgi:hypothetical protein
MEMRFYLLNLSFNIGKTRVDSQDITQNLGMAEQCQETILLSP